jgi:hypothetical protein
MSRAALVLKRRADLAKRPDEEVSANPGFIPCHSARADLSLKEIKNPRHVKDMMRSSVAVNTMSLSRRSFLCGAGAFLMGAAVPFPVLAAGGAVAGDDCIAVGSGMGVCLINLARRTYDSIQVGFPVHSLVQHPTRASRFLAIEKWGYGAAEVDFATKTVIRKISSPKGTWFYGHGFTMPESDSYFITRASLETGLGSLVAYAPDTLTPGVAFEVTPGGLHECHVLADRTVLVSSSGIRTIGNGMPQNGRRVAKTSLTHVDMKTGKVIMRMEIADEDQIIGHFHVSSRGNVLALSGAKPGGKEQGGRLYYAGNVGAALREIPIPGETQQHITGEMLSVDITADGSRAAVTSPMSSLIFLVDMEKGVFLRARQNDGFGVAYDPAADSFISTGKMVKGIDRNFADADVIPIQGDGQERFFNGAHSILIKAQARV